MHFAYMDESGNTGRNLRDAQQPTHLIATTVVDESRIQPLHDHLRQVAEAHFPSDWKQPDFEFHGQDLFSGSGHFASLSPQERIDVFDDVLIGIEKSDAQVIVRGVDKKGLRSKYTTPFHPHDIALMFTIESIERLARDLDCRVLLVADEAREIEEAALRDLAEYQVLGTSWGWCPEEINCIIDTIHFVRSETNWGIQLVDCVTFIASRQRKIDAGIVKTNDAVTKLWTDRIEPFVHENRVWWP